MYYEDVFSRLNSEGVRYLVVGGVAVNLHGVPRMTADLGLMVDTSSENISRLVKALEFLDYKPRAPVDPRDLIDPDIRRQWREQKHMMVFSFYQISTPYHQVDIFLENPINFEDTYGRKEIMNAEGLEVPVIAIDHLILMKSLADRKQDKADIEALEAVKKIKEKEKKDGENRKG